MSNLQPVIDRILSNFESLPETPVKDFGFEHRKWRNGDGKFRWVHFEHYTTDKVEIVHLVVMPKMKSRAPIYGFDVINISGTLTGMFLDLTPVDGRVVDIEIPRVGTPRPIPDWGTFFSDNFLCCKPNSVDDVMTAVDVLEQYLPMLPDMSQHNFSDRQQFYIEKQRQNPQTRKMLAAHIGQERADEYFYNYLWPDI